MSASRKSWIDVVNEKPQGLAQPAMTGPQSKWVEAVQHTVDNVHAMPRQEIGAGKDALAAWRRAIIPAPVKRNG